jgi:hypothetical protein
MLWEYKLGYTKAKDRELVVIGRDSESLTRI